MRIGGIAAGLAGGALCWLLLAQPMVESIASLMHARQTRANLEVRLSAPPERQALLVAPDMAIGAGSRAGATRVIADRVRKAAAQGGVLVEMMRPIAAGPGLAGVEVRLSGPEKAVIALVDSVERDTPLIRFREWRATAIADGGVRIEGGMVAAWR